MQEEVLVKVERVSKKFCKDLKKSLWYGMKDITAEVFGVKYKSQQLRKDEFWAIKNVSFELKRGECLGLIGHNGAGKSTLLKMLNGMIKPNEGIITMKGRIGALIELGAGFNPILTGRENIYVNGQILGFTKKEIDQKFDEIVEFAEIGAFIDSPVQNYSSGMKVRLGFAVAAQMEPDVLIIDEVLAVGDVGFRSKCLARINEILEVAAVIFVSHSMNQVSRISAKALLLEAGKVEYYGNSISRAIEKYYDKFDPESVKVIGNRKAIEICKFELNNSTDMMPATLDYNQELRVRMRFRSLLKTKEYYVMFSFFDKELKGVALSNSEFQKIKFSTDSSGIVELNAILPNLFAPGNYVVNVHFIEAKGKNTSFGISTYQAIRSFRVLGDLIPTQIPVQISAKWSSEQLVVES
ncbi:MAG: ABC transporter ATP-binding protein [Bacteroidota bacterium]